jgi:predicted amidohydrolase
MIDRKGEVVGYYDKNYLVPFETSCYGIVPGEDIAVFECDFGRVGAVICFDLNFEELRLKYREAKCDIIVFPSHFDGGLLRNIFAHETGAYFVSCYSGSFCRSAVFDPLGYEIASSTNYYRSIVTDINLDYKICHLDENRQKFAAAKKKYGDEFGFCDNGFIGTVILTSESEERTVDDIIDEFKIETREQYYARSRKHREDNL